MLCDMFFFFNDTATTEIYTLSLHDALPISNHRDKRSRQCARKGRSTIFAPSGYCSGHSTERDLMDTQRILGTSVAVDRKSTRLNSSHANISYAVFCLKKKKTRQ